MASSGKKTERRQKKGVLFYLPLFGGILLLLIALCMVLLFLTRYTLLDGKVFRTDAAVVDLKDAGLTDLHSLERCQGAQEMDLRGNNLSVSGYLDLQKALPGCSIRWDVPLNDELLDSYTEELSLEDIPADWVNITYFQRLKTLTFLRCSDQDAIHRLKEFLPECEINYTVRLGGTWYARDTEAVELTQNATDYAELSSQLGLFTNLKELILHDDLLTAEEKRSLMEQYPDVTFVWNISAGDATLPSTVSEITFEPGEAVDIKALSEQLDLFSKDITVDFTGSSVPLEDRLSLMESHPDANITWRVSFGETEVPWDTKELNLNEVPLDSVEQVEEAIALLPKLEVAEMCDTGLTTQEMAGLREEYTDIKFIWRVYLADYNLRTDATYFMPSIIYNGADLTDYNIWPLQYCTELEALDLGHMPITDLSFLYNMPKIKYLILAETYVSDLTPLTSLKDLAYLEIFNTPLYDLSPLLECPNLQDLNISYIKCKADTSFKVLNQFTDLKRLWYCGCYLSGKQQRQLQRNMPDCEFYFNAKGEPTGSTWRYGGLYYEMRDAFHAIYMPGGTNDIDEDGNQIIIDDWGNEFHLEGWAGEQRWWELYPDWDIHIVGITC